MWRPVPPDNKRWRSSSIFHKTFPKIWFLSRGIKKFTDIIFGKTYKNTSDKVFFVPDVSDEDYWIIAGLDIANLAFIETMDVLFKHVKTRSVKYTKIQDPSENGAHAWMVDLKLWFLSRDMASKKSDINYII